jgi:hypothetical protein
MTNWPQKEGLLLVQPMVAKRYIMKAIFANACAVALMRWYQSWEPLSPCVATTCVSIYIDTDEEEDKAERVSYPD